MKYYGVKISKAGNELLEVFDAENLKDARKYFCIKYMTLALSCQTSVDVVTKRDFDRMYAVA